eukprot:1839450-Amphidinium_carterae.1
MASRRPLAHCFQWSCIAALLGLCLSCIFEDATSSVQSWVPSVVDALVDPSAEAFLLYLDHAVCSRPSASPIVNVTTEHNGSYSVKNMSNALLLGTSFAAPRASGA